MDQDIRWKQRFSNYEKAFQQLSKAVTEVSSPSALEKEGTIQRFEFTHELAWKLMQDFLEYEGIIGITGSRSATRAAFNKGLIQDGQLWMDMIQTRNKTVHTYLEKILVEEYSNIIQRYFEPMQAFYEHMKGKL